VDKNRKDISDLKELIRRVEEDQVLTETELRELHIQVMRDGVVSEEEKKLFEAALIRLRRKRVKQR